MSDVEKLTSSIKQLTSIIKDIQGTGQINLKHSKSSAELVLSKDQVGDNAFNAIISCIETIRKKEMESLNKHLIS